MGTHNSKGKSTPTPSKSRRQRPQYNSDNESSAQLGQASSERLDAPHLSKWNTNPSDEAFAAAEITLLPARGTVLRPKATRKAKGAQGQPVNVFPVRLSVDVTRASMEAVRGSPPILPKRKSIDEFETWCCPNETHRERDLVGMGSWVEDRKTVEYPRYVDDASVEGRGS